MFQFLIGFYLVLINRKEAASTGWALQGLNCKVRHHRVSFTPVHFINTLFHSSS